MRTFSVAKDWLIPSDFLQSGLDHVAAAKNLFASDPTHYDSGGYLAHIGVELLLKGWLLEVAGEFEGIHNLKRLFAFLVEKHGVAALSEEHQSTLETLDQFEQLRYPNRQIPVEIGDEDFPRVDALVEHLCRSMPPAIPTAMAQTRGEHLQKGGRILMKRRVE